MFVRGNHLKIVKNKKMQQKINNINNVFIKKKKKTFRHSFHPELKVFELRRDSR